VATIVPVDFGKIRLAGLGVVTVGGYFSGRRDRSGVKRTTSSCLWLDARRYQREGWLRPGSMITLSWARNGEPWGSIGMTAKEDAVTLRYTVRVPGAREGDSVVERVSLAWTSCNFGGRRFWFLCPRCRRRAALLYLLGRLFLCRRCCDLAYPSQREDLDTRLLGKMRAIRERLGGSSDIVSRFPSRPKGMRELTYWALREEYYRLELAREASFEGQLLGLARRHGWLDQLGGAAVEG
jgi:hypothetical protein